MITARLELAEAKQKVADLQTCINAELRRIADEQCRALQQQVDDAATVQNKARLMRAQACEHKVGADPGKTDFVTHADSQGNVGHVSTRSYSHHSGKGEQPHNSSYRVVVLLL